MNSFLDELRVTLIWSSRNRKRQRSKSSGRDSVNKRSSTTTTTAVTTTPTKTRANSSVRTRRLQSSSSSDSSASGIVSPVTVDDSQDFDEPTKKKSDYERSDAYSLRPIRTQEPESNQRDSSVSPEKSGHGDDDEAFDEAHDKNIDRVPLDESIREFLWQPTKLSASANARTITEVTDHTGVTVLIRELDDISSSSSNPGRPPRFLGYGNGGRGGRH